MQTGQTPAHQIASTGHRPSATEVDLFARALIKDTHGRFLLTKPRIRPDEPWEMPGDQVRVDETCTMSIVRTLRDDLGILTWPVSIIFVQDEFCKSSKRHLLSITYCVSIISGTLKVNNAGHIGEARWFAELEISEGVSEEAVRAINSRQIAAIMAS